MAEPTPEQVQAAGEEAVTVFLRRLGTDLSTGNYVLLVESLSEDGRTGLWVSKNEDQQSWVTLGLLEYGYTLEQMDIADVERDD